MRKSILVILLFGLAWGLVGCGEDTSQTAERSTSSAWDSSMEQDSAIKPMIDNLPKKDLSEEVYIEHARAFYEEAKAYLEAHPEQSYADAMKSFSGSSQALPTAAEVLVAAEQVSLQKVKMKDGRNPTKEEQAHLQAWIKEHYPNALKVVKAKESFETLQKDDTAITFSKDGTYFISSGGAVSAESQS